MSTQNYQAIEVHEKYGIFCGYWIEVEPIDHVCNGMVGGGLLHAYFCSPFLVDKGEFRQAF